MARYRFGPKDGPFSDPHRISATLKKVREVCYRDGPMFRFKATGAPYGRFFRHPGVFSLRVRYGLSKDYVGGTSFIKTRATKGPEEGLEYVIRKLKNPPHVSAGDRAVRFALGELGTMYRFGAANGPDDVGADSYDCSGLTMIAWDEATKGNIQLPHSANSQRDSALVSVFYDSDRLAPGDLVFFNFPNMRHIERPNASHVGLYYKGGRVIDTRSLDSPVAIRDIEWASTVGFGRVRAG